MAGFIPAVLCLPLLVALSGDKCQVPPPGEKEGSRVHVKSTWKRGFSPIAGEIEHTSSQPSGDWRSTNTTIWHAYSEKEIPQKRFLAKVVLPDVTGITHVTCNLAADNTPPLSLPKAHPSLSQPFVHE